MSVKPLILHSGALSAQENMRLDAQLLEDLKTQTHPLLRFYTWSSPSATAGCLIKPQEFIHFQALTQAGITLAQRPTGGGILFHAWDFTFSFLMPATHPHFSDNTLKNYAYVNARIIQAFKQLTGLSASLHTPCAHKADPRFCMAHLTCYDVVWEGKKIAGGAQRKTKWGYLHQGSLPLLMPDFSLLENILIDKQNLLPLMQEHTLSLYEQFNITREKLTECLIEIFLS